MSGIFCASLPRSHPLYGKSVCDRCTRPLDALSCMATCGKGQCHRLRLPGKKWCQEHITPCSILTTQYKSSHAAARKHVPTQDHLEDFSKYVESRQGDEKALEALREKWKHTWDDARSFRLFHQHLQKEETLRIRHNRACIATGGDEGHRVYQRRLHLLIEDLLRNKNWYLKQSKDKEPVQVVPGRVALTPIAAIIKGISDPHKTQAKRHRRKSKRSRKEKGVASTSLLSEQNWEKVFKDAKEYNLMLMSRNDDDKKDFWNASLVEEEKRRILIQSASELLSRTDWPDSVITQDNCKFQFQLSLPEIIVDGKLPRRPEEIKLLINTGETWLYESSWTSVTFKGIKSINQFLHHWKKLMKGESPSAFFRILSLACLYEIPLTEITVKMTDFPDGYLSGKTLEGMCDLLMYVLNIRAIVEPEIETLVEKFKEMEESDFVSQYFRDILAFGIILSWLQTATFSLTYIET